jgi:hypothetical protein
LKYSRRRCRGVAIVRVSFSNLMFFTFFSLSLLAIETF